VAEKGRGRVDIQNDLASLLGAAGWLTAPRDTAPYTRDWLDRYGVPPIGVARPTDTQQVAEVVRLCRQAGVAVVPQGGGTGLVGASVATSPNTVIVSLARMNKIEMIDEQEHTAVVEAGVILENLHTALDAQDLSFPMHLGSEGTAQIGGLIATNAGGSHAFRFGMMSELVLGMEVVLLNGDVWTGMRRLIKDNSGLQLRKLFCGSEGRLGIVTRAALRLYPAQRERATAMIACPSLNAMLKTGQALRRSCGELLVAMEFFDTEILDLALHHIPDLTNPMDTATPFYILLELATSIDTLDLHPLLESAMEPVFEAGWAIDAVVAQSQAQRAALWRIREDLPEGTLREGRQLKHDIAVPVSAFPAFLEDSAARIAKILPGTRIWTFGHLADGNIHYNLSPPSGQVDFSNADMELSSAIYENAERHGGTFAAEHGVGHSKHAVADQLRSTTERDLMSKILMAADPEQIMNPEVP